MPETIKIIIGILSAILIALVGFIYNRNRKIKAYYEVVWKKPSSLKPKEVLGMRPFNKYYYQRPEDDLIGESLDKQENVLIIGPPLSGKSRAAYQAVMNLRKPYDVIVPKCTDINRENFIFPKHLKFWRPRIILFDDLHRLVEQQNFERLFEVARENNVVILATCRSGMEHKKAKNKMLDKNIDLETIFANSIELKRVSEDVGKQIAHEVRRNWDEVRFDGTIGSIFMSLKEMERRFDECTEVEKTILRAVKNLYICGVYEENQVFPLNWIKTLAKKNELEGKDFEWNGWLENLENKELLTLVKDKVQVEEVYLEYLVKPKSEMSNLDIFEEMLATFAGVTGALLRLGDRAYAIGTVELEKAEYMKTAITAYEEALRTYTLERFPMDYAMIQNNLGSAYGTLAEVEAKAENCKKAITAHEEALKLYTLERFPMNYGITQMNLGTAYRTLAEVEEKAENSKRAIKAFEEALKVRIPERFPVQYGMTQNNLGAAYRTLAEVEAKAENCKKAIESYKEALKVHTLERLPRYYAMIQNNLGNAYTVLAEVEAKAENCKKAITALEEALKVKTLERFPLDYAMTQNNLGNAYGTLAEVEAKAENCKKAIKAYKEALKIYTLERFPMDYAMIQNNLGSAHGKLAQAEAKAENCKKAITAFEEALKVRTLERFPMDYGTTQNNLGNAYRTLAEVEAKAENCKRAIAAYEEALKVRTLERFPMQYGTTQNNLGAAYRTLAEVEAKAENCKRAIKAYEEALRVFTEAEFPELHKSVSHNLEILLVFCGGE
ncbi:MAG: tetratricopeptide repeat protein [Dehalococcoidia bacterium]